METDDPSATYMNLKPGKYTLAVKGANNDGIWSDAKELSIVVLPPFGAPGGLTLYMYYCLQVFYLLLSVFSI
ncbi:triple tyrosine motif-containing protein [Niabella hibiscisoli]|uniref:triple tyrosine motif-containing protein n=1 Tax=Niabella hibiscisoli TaxID=1825928 RepID=UPI001F1125C4|nr:triple tyrosine motif-containing protein [Niabella hibiscisoli]MCH5718895.1 hypothetical protein [Niabella hibiscisoli]